MLPLIHRLSPSRVASQRQTLLGAARTKIERLTCGTDASDEQTLMRYCAVIYYYTVMRLEIQWCDGGVVRVTTGFPAKLPTEVSTTYAGPSLSRSGVRSADDDG